MSDLQSNPEGPCSPASPSPASLALFSDALSAAGHIQARAEAASNCHLRFPRAILHFGLSRRRLATWSEAASAFAGITAAYPTSGGAKGKPPKSRRDRGRAQQVAEEVPSWCNRGVEAAPQEPQVARQGAEGDLAQIEVHIQHPPRR